MSDFFYLTLDTTGPSVNILCTDISDSSGIMVTLLANEVLSSEIPEVYFVDSLGARTDYVFSQISDVSWQGHIIDESTESGEGVLYCIVKDDLLNPSTLTSKSIYVSGESIYTDGTRVKHTRLYDDRPKTIQFKQGIKELSIVNMGEAEVYIKLDNPNFSNPFSNDTNYLNDLVRSIDIVKTTEFYTVTFVSTGFTIVQWSHN